MAELLHEDLSTEWESGTGTPERELGTGRLIIPIHNRSEIKKNREKQLMENNDSNPNNKLTSETGTCYSNNNNNNNNDDCDKKDLPEYLGFNDEKNK